MPWIAVSRDRRPVGRSVPPSTAVVSRHGADLTEPKLRQEILVLQRRIDELAALLRLAIAVRPRAGGPAASVPDGLAKARILRAVDGARSSLRSRGILRFLYVSPSRFHAWRRRQRACALDDQAACPRSSPQRPTRGEIQAIEEMVTSWAYRHVPTRTLAVLAQRLDTVWASPSTWYRLVRSHGWRRPRLRLHPSEPKGCADDTPRHQAAHRRDRRRRPPPTDLGPLDQTHCPGASGYQRCQLLPLALLQVHAIS